MQGQCMDLNSFQVKQLCIFDSTLQCFPEPINVMESLRYSTSGKTTGTVPLETHKEPFSNNDKK